MGVATDSTEAGDRQSGRGRTRVDPPHPGGDKAACTECIDLHSPGVYRLALRMTGSPEEAEDITQETFLHAFKAIDSFEGRSGLGTWLYRIAHNTALMRLRKTAALRFHRPTG